MKAAAIMLAMTNFSDVTPVSEDLLLRRLLDFLVRLAFRSTFSSSFSLPVRRLSFPVLFARTI